MSSLDVIKRPVITEKSVPAMDDKKYTFEVDTRAGKALVKQAVETTSGVRVKNVNIVGVRVKFKRVGKYARHTRKRHKAIVTLTEDSEGVQLLEAAE